MAWTTTSDLDAFQAAAGAFLRARPVQHTLLLTVVSSLEAAGSGRYGDQPPVFGWWRAPSGAVDGAYLRTPPRPPLLSAMPAEAADALARTLAGADGADGADGANRARIGGVNGARPVAEAFADAWERHTGEARGVDHVQRLYRLDTLTPSGPVRGRARTATTDDRDLLLSWYAAFGRDTGALPEGEVARAVDDRLSHHGALLWEVDGEPVATAAVSRTIADTVRVSLVYTPPEWRGHGYGGAVTAAVSRAARAAGAERVLLFTDLANPTSNALYQRIGYRPVEDHLMLTFAP
ncbi:GNAT family N-acetyltransferase [Streptomyces sp. NPDC021098]|uniref:GNAT family N-acetyltransferase n=1 Tax=unclassified Streptomyces TaxID=2593676 RepID=UPI00378E3B6A